MQLIDLFTRRDLQKEQLLIVVWWVLRVCSGQLGTQANNLKVAGLSLFNSSFQLDDSTKILIEVRAALPPHHKDVLHSWTQLGKPIDVTAEHLQQST